MTKQTWDQKCLLKAEELVETNRAFKIEEDTDEKTLDLVADDLEYAISEMKIEDQAEEILEELGGTSKGIEEKNIGDAAEIVLKQTILNYARDLITEE